MACKLSFCSGEARADPLEGYLRGVVSCTSWLLIYFVLLMGHGMGFKSHKIDSQMHELMD